MDEDALYKRLTREFHETAGIDHEGTKQDQLLWVSMLTEEVGELAEKAWHHPNLSLQWGEVGVEIWTHEVDGLQKPDFVMAAKMDRIYEDYT